MTACKLTEVHTIMQNVMNYNIHANLYSYMFCIMYNYPNCNVTLNLSVNNPCGSFILLCDL